VLNIFLGAGFAQGLHLPGTEEITNHISTLKANGVYLADGRYLPLGPILWKIANSYYDAPNFETLLHLVESMVSAERSRLGFASADQQKVAFNAFMDPTPRLAPITQDANALGVFGAAMMGEVADYLDKSMTRSRMEKQGTIREFLWPFLSEEVRISTLNYDDSIERSVEGYVTFWDGFTDDNPGSIDYDGFRQVHRAELLHLHGSIRFAPISGYPSTYPPSLQRFKSNVDAKPNRQPLADFNALTQAGELIFTGPMLSGLRKTEKLVVEPYGLYHQRFTTGLLDSPRFLCVGYGGNDTYVNSAILRAKAVHGSRFKPYTSQKLTRRALLTRLDRLSIFQRPIAFSMYKSLHPSGNVSSKVD
jgi:hypothetical protein